MTKRENYAELRTIAIANNRTDLVEFIDHEVELLNKKNSAPKKATAKQLENESLKDEILGFMGTDRWTVSEITNHLNEMKGSDFKPQRISAIITQLKEDNAVVRTVEKRVAYFTVA